MRTYFVAWWNVENLFDSKSAERTSKLVRTIGDDVSDWTAALRDKKISQLATVIAAMNANSGPDLLGVCEIENRHVLDLLVEAVNKKLETPRRYAIIHADTNDARGIDVAFIYDSKLFSASKDTVFFHVVMRRNATRDIVQVTFKTKTTAERNWVVFGNHWPSRSGGQYESQGYRAIAGETLAFFHQRVLQVLGDDTAVLAMGDFNDEPFDPSLVTHALSTRLKARVTGARENPLLWNLMWPIAGGPDGSFYFDQPNVLDQFLVNKNMAANDAPIKAIPESVTIVRHPGAAAGVYKKPVPFGGMGKPVNENGFSDHFPITMTVTEKD
jgi:predicted extracellular nuclease